MHPLEHPPWCDPGICRAPTGAHKSAYNTVRDGEGREVLRLWLQAANGDVRLVVRTPTDPPVLDELTARLCADLFARMAGMLATAGR